MRYAQLKLSSEHTRREPSKRAGFAPAAWDFRYRDQIRGVSSSAPRNIAKGCGRYRPADFARYLEFAVASLEETKHPLSNEKVNGECPRDHYDETVDVALIDRSRNSSGGVAAYDAASGHHQRRLPHDHPASNELDERRAVDQDCQYQFH